MHFLATHQKYSKSKSMSVVNFKTKQARFVHFFPQICAILYVHYEHVIQVFLLSVRMCWSLAVTLKRLPGIDEILGQADVSRGPCDGDLAF